MTPGNWSASSRSGPAPDSESGSTVHPSSGPVISPDWQAPPKDNQPEGNNWLKHARRFSYVRAHIGVFAVGSVALLALNLLIGSSAIWADSWIVSWGLLLLMHAVIAGIAFLALQLMEDDDIRPASEVRWDPKRTWTTPKPKDIPPEPAPVITEWRASAAPEARNAHDDEKVSWKTATDAAWLARPAGTGQDNPEPEAGSSRDATSPDSPRTD